MKPLCRDGTIIISNNNDSTEHLYVFFCFRVSFLCLSSILLLPCRPLYSLLWMSRLASFWVTQQVVLCFFQDKETLTTCCSYSCCYCFRFRCCISLFPPPFDNYFRCSCSFSWRGVLVVLIIASRCYVGSLLLLCTLSLELLHGCFIHSFGCLDIPLLTSLIKSSHNIATGRIMEISLLKFQRWKSKFSMLWSLRWLSSLFKPFK